MNRPAKIDSHGYEQDFYLWTQAQARALREAAQTGANMPLDWENLAEEIESLGRSDRREVYSRVRNILEHLLKLQCSTAKAPRPGWRSTIQRERSDLELVIADSPSLASQVEPAIHSELRKAARMARASLEEQDEWTAAAQSTLDRASFTAEQVLGDWWPPDPDQD